LREYGLNRLARARRRSAWAILLEQFRSVLLAFLAVAAGLSFAVGQWLEAAAILVAVLIAGLVGFATEVRAVRSMEALQELIRMNARVRRDGRRQTVPAERLVPGDVVLVGEGDLPGADVRLTEASGLEVDESPLTGESLPVAKGTEAVPEDTPLAERRSMLFRGTTVTRGNGEGVVVATGGATELGRIAALARAAEPEHTPLEKRLEGLGRRLIVVTLGLGVLVAASGILAGQPALLMLQTAIVLAVATIPEGLPVVATLAMARGMWRMARRNAVLNRLAAVETLGSTSCILTDKTGTLTHNRMELTRLVLPDGEVTVAAGSRGTRLLREGEAVRPGSDSALARALEAAVLANEAAATGEGDPLEWALLQGAEAAGLDARSLREQWPTVRQEPFDPQRRMMATVHEGATGRRVVVKGAPEAVLAACDSVAGEGDDNPLEAEARRRWERTNQSLAEDGLRVVALAGKPEPDPGMDPFSGLTFLGLAGLEDPPREEVRPALAQCQEAGIRVIMITGDQVGTARHIARALGLVRDERAAVVEGRELAATGPKAPSRERLLDADVFARVSPQQKLDLIRLYQDAGGVVAMTGDGVNDAPALKQADMGVAMGRRGTQAAREAADMVLKDDAFATIVAAVEQGRAIFENIRKASVYLLSGNMGEILAVTGASVAGAPLPLLPLQILYLNLVNDLFPALALGFGEAPSGVMRQPPRAPEHPVLDRERWWAVGLYGLVLAAAVLLAFGLALAWLDLPAPGAVTVAFFSLSLGRLWHVANMRHRGSRVLVNEVTRNPYMALALLVSLLLLGAAWSVPVLREVLGLGDPGSRGWLLALGASLIPLVAGQVALVALGPGKNATHGGGTGNVR
jgi:Ca2+-transporting ATPase